MEPVFNQDIENGLRLTVLLCDLGGKILRDKFHECGISRDPTELYDQLNKKHLPLLRSLKQKKIINAIQWNLLFPSSKETDTSKWDISLLITLLRQNSICNLNVPFRYFDTEPDENDRSKLANIVRLQKYRNDYFGHRSSTSVPSFEFDGLWDKIGKVLQELGTSSDKIDEAKLSSLDKEAVTSLQKLERQSAEQFRNIQEKVNYLESHVETIRANMEKPPTKSLNADQCKKIILMLKEYYKSEKSAPREEWDPIEDVRDFSDLYVQLEMIDEPVNPVNNKESFGDIKPNSKEPSDIYDVFNSHENCKTSITRVVITGPAGMGKTTLCQKLVFDYANPEAQYFSTFSDYEFLFFIQCRKLENRERSISNYVTDMIEEPDLANILISYLKQNGEKVLFVIDGLDELNHRNKDLDKLLNGQLFKKSRIIVTTRSEGLTSNRKKCFHSSFKIAELKPKDVKSFVDKHINARERMELCGQISGNPLLIDLSKIPLNLYLICLLWQDGDKGLPEKQSELYYELVFSFARRLASKREIDNCNDDDILMSLLLPLSTLAYNSLKKGELYFDKSELHKVWDSLKKGKLYFDNSELQKVWNKINVGTKLEREDVIKLGLVSTTTMNKLKPSLRYEFEHKSYQEFLCALFVNHIFNSADDEQKDDLLKEFSWLLEMDWKQPSVKFVNQLPVQFLLGLSEEADTRLILRNVRKQIRILTLNDHTCEAVFQCFKDISPGVFSQISTSLVRVMPEDIVITSRFEQSTMLDILKSACESPMVSEREWKVKCIQLNSLPGFRLESQLEIINKIISRDSCQLECLQINNHPVNNLFSESAEFTKLIPTWQKSKSLRSLVINLNLNSGLAPVLVECLKHSNKGTTCQKHLTITGCNKDDPLSSSRETCLSNLSNLSNLSKFLAKCNILETLVLKNMFIPRAVVTSILEGISQNKTLKELHFSNNNMSKSIPLNFSKMLKMNNTLKVLNLKGNVGIGDEMSNSIASALKENSCLTSLDLSENSITSNGLSALDEMISVNNNITTFHVGPVPGQDESGYRSLCKAFENRDRSATSLILGSWIIRAPLLRYPAFRLPLAIIDLCHEEIPESELLLLLEFVSVTTTLTTLKLEEASIGDGVMLKFGKALNLNRSVVSLNISRNNITGGGIEFMLEGLTGGDKELNLTDLTLVKLDMSYNRLGEIGASLFFDAFSKTENLKLKEVNFAGNGISNRGIEPLMLTWKLEHGTPLVSLDLSHNLLTWNTLKKIREDLQKSKYLKLLNLSGNIGIRSNQVQLKEFLMTSVTKNEETDIICSPFSKPKARVTNDLRNLACIIQKKDDRPFSVSGLSDADHPSSVCKKPKNAICTVTETDLKNIDLVLILDCSSSTTYHVVWRVKRALQDFVKQSWGGSLGNSAHVAVLRCTVWSTKSSVLCSGFKTTQDAVTQEMKKVRSESMKKKTHQKPMDTATLLEAFRQTEGLEFRKNSTRICIYIGELPYDFPEAESATDLYRTFGNLVQKQIFTYFVLRGELDQDIEYSNKLVPGLLLRSLVLRTGGDFLTLNKWITKRIKKTLDRFVCDATQVAKARLVIIKPVIEEIAKAGMKGLSTEEIQDISKLKLKSQDISKLKLKSRKADDFGLSALLMRLAVEDDMDTINREPLQQTIQEYISITQKIAWSKISMHDAAAGIMQWSRKQLVSVTAADLQKILSQTADIRQRIHFTLFRLLNETDGSFDDQANVEQDENIRVVCPVARVERDLRCYWNDSIVKFYCHS